MSTKEEELAATLTLLFADLEPKAIAAALNAHFEKSSSVWSVLAAWGELTGNQLIYFSADDVLQGIDDNEEEYTGTREHLNACVMAHELDDRIWETFGYERDDVVALLREQKLIKPKEEVT